MTEAHGAGLPLMHPVTRLGRVVQQLRSFGDLHAGELDGFADELEASGADELARRLRIYRDMQRDEGQMVIEALAELRTDLLAAADQSAAAVASGTRFAAGATGAGASAANGAAGARAGAGATAGDGAAGAGAGGNAGQGAEGAAGKEADDAASGGAGAGEDAGRVFDPAINSPRRARWLAEQAAEAERLRQPFSRRNFFGRGTPRTDS